MGKFVKTRVLTIWSQFFDILVRFSHKFDVWDGVWVFSIVCEFLSFFGASFWDRRTKKKQPMFNPSPENSYKRFFENYFSRNSVFWLKFFTNCCRKVRRSVICILYLRICESLNYLDHLLIVRLPPGGRSVRKWLFKNCSSMSAFGRTVAKRNAKKAGKSTHKWNCLSFTGSLGMVISARASKKHYLISK